MFFVSPSYSFPPSLQVWNHRPGNVDLARYKGHGWGQAYDRWEGSESYARGRAGRVNAIIPLSGAASITNLCSNALPHMGLAMLATLELIFAPLMTMTVLAMFLIGVARTTRALVRAVNPSYEDSNYEPKFIARTHTMTAKLERYRAELEHSAAKIKLMKTRKTGMAGQVKQVMNQEQTQSSKFVMPQLAEQKNKARVDVHDDNADRPKMSRPTSGTVSNPRVTPQKSAALIRTISSAMTIAARERRPLPPGALRASTVNFMYDTETDTALQNEEDLDEFSTKIGNMASHSKSLSHSIRRMGIEVDVPMIQVKRPVHSDNGTVPNLSPINNHSVDNISSMAQGHSVAAEKCSEVDFNNSSTHITKSGAEYSHPEAPGSLHAVPFTGSGILAFRRMNQLILHNSSAKETPGAAQSLRQPEEVEVDGTNQAFGGKPGSCPAALPPEGGLLPIETNRWEPPKHLPDWHMPSERDTAKNEITVHLNNPVIEIETEREAISLDHDAAGDIHKTVPNSAVGDRWLTESDSSSGYILLRNSMFDTMVELPLSGPGVLFRSNNSGTIQRCWADGTFYDRFSFRTNTSSSESSLKSLTSLLQNQERGLGLWHAQEVKDGRLCILQHDKEILIMSADDFAYTGGGRVGVLVKQGMDPIQMDATAIGLVVSRTLFGIEEELRAYTATRKAPQVFNITAAETGGMVAKHSEIEIPSHVKCPISGKIMRDPWVASDGHSYEKHNIERWLLQRRTSPMTGLLLANSKIVPNNALRDIIGECYDFDSEASSSDPETQKGTTEQNISMAAGALQLDFFAHKISLFFTIS